MTGTRLVLPRKGPWRIESVGSWQSGELQSRVLLRTTEGQEANQELVVLLLYDPDARGTKKPNKHFHGAFGDCYIVAAKKSPTEPGAEGGCDDENIEFGVCIPQKWLGCVLSNLKLHQETTFSPFRAIFYAVLNQSLDFHRKALQSDKDLSKLVTKLDKAVVACVRGMHHVHIEKTVVVVEKDEFPDILIKSKDALVYALKTLLSAFHDWTRSNGGCHTNCDPDVCIPEQLATVAELLPQQLPNPSLTCEEFAAKMGVLVARMIEDHDTRAATLAKSKAEMERRTQETIRRQEEVAAKKGAEDAKKAERLAEERIARLNAETNRPYSQRGQPRLPQKCSTARIVTTQRKTVHDHHISNGYKAQREANWMGNQQQAQFEAETNRREKAYQEMREEQRRRGAAAALRSQVMPCKPTLASFVPEAWFVPEA